MKRLILFLGVISLSFIAGAQNKYIYNIISFTGNMKKEGVKVYVDNGRTIDKLKDDKGKTIRFNTIASALMYFTAQGWELYSNGQSVSGEGMVLNGYGSNSTVTTSFWIIRRQCTEEELNECLINGLKEN